MKEWANQLLNTYLATKPHSHIYLACGPLQHTRHGTQPAHSLSLPLYPIGGSDTSFHAMSLLKKLGLKKV